MRRSLLVASLVLSAAATPAAAGDARHRGGCSYSIVDPPGSDTGELTVVLSTDVVVYSPTTGNPVSADVTCTYDFHDQGSHWTTHTTSFSGTGVVAGAETARVPAAVAPTDTFICMTVDYTSDATPTDQYCTITDATYPLEGLGELVDATVDGVAARDELCAALRAAVPVDAPGVHLAPDGDLTVTRVLLVDC